ncbi:ATP-dependent DNA helicase [Haloarcula sp. 1CSR25-25]|uniref:ATP-dependent DNA helicase n=1 Tax=Haloarcula sp. 1CSR25-25 TaxID=2862545 RepID=UPI002895203E|nr:ATP-dependent DNA helicase [Haloarcula sp. 1CSR25-25]MDT3437772.1 ATP-dependent DNA helicase [Haloarcula sp. 1CSR25-25]
MFPSRIHEEFPAPGYRGAQEQALNDIQAAFAEGADIVLVQAPTGSGKSLLARAIAGCARTSVESEEEQSYDAFYTTPQVSQLDDVADDDLLEDLCIVRGKNNYNCILPGQTDTPVSRAKCVRESGFECDIKNRCPYFTDRATAADSRIAAMTLAYFMQTANSELFGKRDVVVIDEAHGLGKWAEMYGTISLSPTTVPFWEQVDVPDIKGLEHAVQFCEHLYSISERRLDELSTKEVLNSKETAEREQIYRLRGDISWLTADFRSEDGDTEWVVNQPDDHGQISIKPLNPERYLKHTIWDRGNKFALLSATILNKDAFCRKMGLSPSDVAMVKVPHTFPVENRMLYDITQGKMTLDDRDETLPKIAQVIAQVMQKHRDTKGLIHCHSYDIQAQLADRLAELGVEERVRQHRKENRDAKLADWKASDGNDVFLSVKMEEALDLSGDLARWQVICKAPYLNTGDSAVATRLEDGRWNWYYRNALETVIQACGRIIRTPDDYGATYLADSSLLDVFENAEHDMPPWFEAQVERISKPNLPRVAPEQ